MTAEEWRPVAPRYEISNLGRLRRHDKNGVKVFRGTTLKTGYVSMSINSRNVFRHVLLARAFHGEPAPGQVVRHLNGVPGDDRLENLRWGTPKENAEDSKRHGTNHALNKTHCKWGHEFTEMNTFIDNLGRRICRACKAKHDRAGIDSINQRRRLARIARREAISSRRVCAVLEDGSALVSYRVPGLRYYREWPNDVPKRVDLNAAEFRSLLSGASSQEAGVA